MNSINKNASSAVQFSETAEGSNLLIFTATGASLLWSFADVNVLFALFPEITLIENYGFVDSFTDLQIERLIVELNE